MADSKISIILDAEDKASSTIKGMSATVSTAFKAVAAAAAVGAVAVGAFALKSITEFSKVGDEIEKMAIRTGMGAEAISALRVAADASGTSIETVETAIKVMNKSISDLSGNTKMGEAAFKALGLSFASIKELSPEEQFGQIGNAIAQLPSAAERTAAAMALFGKAGTDLIPLFEEGTFSMEAWSQKAKELGVSFDDLSATQAAQLNDALGEMQMAFQGVMLQVGGALAPVITALIKDVIEPMIPTMRLLIDYGINACRVAFEWLKNAVIELYAWLNQIGVIELFRDAFQRLWTVISTQLWPVLVQLYNTLLPLMPLIKAIAGVIAMLFVAGLYILVQVLTLVIEYVSMLLTAWNSLAAMIMDILAPAIQTVTTIFQNFSGTLNLMIGVINSVVGALSNLIAKAKEAASLGIGGIVGKVSGAISAITGKRAGGGSVAGGLPYLVGERGPEIFKPAGNGTIIPNASLAGAGGGLTINVTGNSFGANMDARDVAMAIGNELMNALKLQTRL